jgi:hypothetical protein
VKKVKPFVVVEFKISLKFLGIVTRTNPSHRRHRHQREEGGSFSEMDSGKSNKVQWLVHVLGFDSCYTQLFVYGEQFRTNRANQYK